MHGDVIGGAHLIEATYDADESDPENEQVIATISGGVPGVTVVDHRLPTDAEDYMVRELNKTAHLTGQISFMDKYNMIDDIETAKKSTC
jgi:hypothetical protein